MDAQLTCKYQKNLERNGKSKRCIFIGYCISSKGYRLWDPELRRVYLSRDVIFFEQDFDGRVKRLKEQSESKGSSEIPSENYEEEGEDTSNDGNNDDNSVAEEVLVQSEGNLRRSERARRPPEREALLLAIGGNLQTMRMLHTVMQTM